MANSSPLLKISSNLEIPQSNRKKFPTENESNSMTDCLDEKQLEISRKNAVTETTRDTHVQDEECLQAEKVIKALLSIDTVNKNENDTNAAVVDLGSVPAGKVSESSVPSEPMVKDSGSNSDDSANYPTVADAKKKRRRRRRTRKRKVIQPENTNEHSTTDLDAKSTTSVSKSPSSTTCSSSVECAELAQGTGEDISIELTKGSDSAISQDETYQDLITEDFVLDFEQRMIKENLFIEHEKLAKDVAAFELELNAQLEKSEAMKQSLKQLKTDNDLLQREKSDLLDDIKTKEDEIATLKEQATSLKMICDELSQWKEGEEKASYIELDHLKSQLISKEDELEFAKIKHENTFKELAKHHGLFLAKILTESQEINITLYTALRLNSGKMKPEIHKTKNVLQLLKQLKQDVITLSDKSSALEITVKQLRDEIESQTRTLTKVTNDKRLLKEQVVEANKHNKALVKEKAKLERDKETLKTEAVRAKNASQTFKARLEELKANARSAKRESEIAIREKQNIEMVLKNLGIDCKALLLNAKNEKNAQSGQQNLQKVTENLEGMVINTEKDQTKLSQSSVESKMKEIEGVKEFDSSFHAFHAIPTGAREASEQSCKLNEFIARITRDGFCLKKISELKVQGDLNVELLFQTLYCDCGCYEDQAARKQFLENIPLLARCMESLENSKASGEKRIEGMGLNCQVDNKVIENMGKELEKLKGENNSLKLERSKQEKSLENYKELVRGYSHIVRELEERVVGIREMKCINRELEKYSVLLEKQKEGLGTQRVGVHDGINLINAMFQRLKSFAGNPMNTDISIPSSEPIPMKSLEQTNKFIKEKLAYNEYNISLLKATLDKKRTEAFEVQIQIHEALFGNEERRVVEPPEQKTCKKARGNGLLGFMKRKSENESGLGKVVESNSALLSEKQLAVVIDLVQRKEQLVLGIQESIDLEERLDNLGKSSREYMDILQGEGSSFGGNKMSANANDDSKANLELLKCLKEKERIENEFSFKEAHIRLLEKQIALLKSERKACLKALRRYEEKMKDFAPNPMVSSLAKLLSSSSASNERKSGLQEERVTSNGNVANGANNGTRRGKTSKLCHGTKCTAAGSNV